MKKLIFNPVQTPRIFEDICEQIRVQLAKGELKPGDKLPGERELAVAFGVGRPSVREALRTLEISGIVTLRKGSKGGAFITNGETQIMTKALNDFMLLGRISFESLREARTHILGVVIKLACQRGTQEDFDNIEKHIDYIEEITDIERRSVASVELFNLIATASHNEAFVLLVDSLSEIIIYVTAKGTRVLYPELSRLRRELLGALRSRDEDAAIRVMDDYFAVVHRQFAKN